MRRTAKQFRRAAWSALEGRYWWAVLAALIAGALGGASGMPTFGFGFDDNSLRQIKELFEGEPQISYALMGFLAVVGGLAAIIGIALFIIGGAVELGHNLYNIRLYTDRGTPSLALLFERFSIFGRALWLRVLMSLKILAWTLLFIVPGIIAAYRYAMAPYILAEHPELTASEAIEQSKAMMAGNKVRLLCLGVSFIGWMLLAALTCGIGVIFLAPYMKAANTAFYMELTGRLPETAPRPEAQAEAAQVGTEQI